MGVNATGRLAKTKANEGGDGTNLPYKISIRDFRQTRCASFSLLGLSPPFGLQLYNLPPPLRPSSFSFTFPLHPSFPLTNYFICFRLVLSSSVSRCVPLERLALTSFLFRHTDPVLSVSNQSSDRPLQRLHPSPSLPNLW